jgi:hypothetical protein
MIIFLCTDSFVEGRIVARLQFIRIPLFLLFLLQPRAGEARIWYITVDGTGDAPTIQAGIDSASAGDIVLVAAGTYTWSDQGTGSEYGMIVFWRGVTGFEVRSECGPEATVLDGEWRGRLVHFQAENVITFDGFTITRGRAPLSYNGGGGLIGHLSAPTIKNCIFTGNTAQWGGGFWYGGVSAPVIEDCLFYGNTAELGAGIFLINSSTPTVFRDCAVYENFADRKGGGIFVYRFLFELERCAIYDNSAVEEGGGLYGEEIEPSEMMNVTIAHNDADRGSGISLTVASQLRIRYSVIAFNQGSAGLFMTGGCALEVGCSDVFGNSGGDAFPPGAIDAGGNFSLDPQFCGVAGSYNYYLQNDSPCMAFNHPYGAFCPLIGAYPAGCGAVPVEEKSWGGIKKLYD